MAGTLRIPGPSTRVAGRSYPSSSWAATRAMFTARGRERQTRLQATPGEQVAASYRAAVTTAANIGVGLHTPPTLTWTTPWRGSTTGRRYSST